MTQMTLEDICENRHRGNAESEAANPTPESKQIQRFEVWSIIARDKGVTSKEIADEMGRPLNCISGRISELKKQKMIAADGRRDGCAILYVRNS